MTLETLPKASRLRAAFLAAPILFLAACNATTGSNPADTAAFRLERFDEMQRINGFEQCSQEGLTLDSQARSRGSSGAFLNSARVLEGCIAEVSPSADAVPEEERMRVHALAVVNYLKGGDIAAARRTLDGFKRNYPDRDLYFGNSTSFVQTAEVLLGRTGEFRLGQFASMNVDAAVKREVRRVNYWKNK